MSLDNQGNIHLVDSRNGRVIVMDATGTYLREYGSPGSGAGQLKVQDTWGASAVAIDAEGFCYVADTWNNRILRFDPEGKFVSGWGNGDPYTKQTTKFFYPRGIEVGPDGLIYVADTGEAEIEVFQPDGKKVRTIGKKGLKRGEFDEPVGLPLRPRWKPVRRRHRQRTDPGPESDRRRARHDQSPRLESRRRRESGDGAFAGSLAGWPPCRHALAEEHDSHLRQGRRIGQELSIGRKQNRTDRNPFDPRRKDLDHGPDDEPTIPDSDPLTVREPFARSTGQTFS